MKSNEELVQEILETGRLMSLATVDEGGPWVSDVRYVHREPWEIFWISSPKTRHSQAILKNAAVAATITIGDGNSGKNIGLQIAGKAKKIEGDDLEIGTKYNAKKKKPAPQEGGLLAGRSWYVLIPEKIELIYEPYFGFTKKSIL